MKQNTFIAILLTFLMLLLVATAAAIFLLQRNTTLEQVMASQRSNQTVIKATADQAASDLAVRKGAIQAADATRAALIGQLTASSQQADRLEAESTRQQLALAEATSELARYTVQLFPLSPKDGAIIQPWQPVEIMLAAQAEAGVDRITVDINGEPFQTFPAEGVPTFTTQSTWIPTEEGPFTIEAVAVDVNGERSQPSQIGLTSAFDTPEQRQAAILRQTEQQLKDLRLTQSTAISLETALSEFFDPHQFIFNGTSNDLSRTTQQAALLQALQIPITARELTAFRDLWKDEGLFAYYDPAEGRVYYYRPDALEGVPEDWLYAHQYAHQLQDDVFRLSTLDLDGLNHDALLARRAFLEADALYLQYLYGQEMDPDQFDAASLPDMLGEAADEQVEAFAPYLQNLLSFYIAGGLEFVSALEEAGGKEAIDQAWLAPPLSTEQIYHPDRNLEGDQPKTVTLSDPGNLIRGTWQPVGESVFGEFLLRQHLSQLSQNANGIDRAATGWAGGQLALYAIGDANLLLMGLTWDSAEEAQEFAAFYGELLASFYDDEIQEPPDNSRCWEGVNSVCLLVDQENTLIIKGPDLESVTVIAGNPSIMSVP